MWNQARVIRSDSKHAYLLGHHCSLPFPHFRFPTQTLSFSLKLTYPVSTEELNWHGPQARPEVNYLPLPILFFIPCPFSSVSFFFFLYSSPFLHLPSPFLHQHPFIFFSLCQWDMTEKEHESATGKSLSVLRAGSRDIWDLYRNAHKDLQHSL